MSEAAAADRWLASVLSDIAPVYADIAPDDVPDFDGDGNLAPHIIITDLSQPGGLDVRAVGRYVLWHQPTYLVKVVGCTESYLDIEDEADAIDTALDNASDAEAGIVWCYRDGLVRYTETADGRMYKHLGGLYVLQVRSET